MAKFLFVLVAVCVALAAAQDYSPTNYNAGDSGRSETISPDGSVQGQYSYTDPNGKVITVKYRAGKDGYQVEGDHLPKAPSAGPQHHAPVAPTHPPLPQHPASNFNPSVNSNIPNHPPVAPTYPPNHPALNYNPLYNPYIQNHPPAAPTHPPQHSTSFNHHNTNVPAFGHPNALSGRQHKSGGRVSVSQQAQGFTYNFETS